MKKISWSNFKIDYQKCMDSLQQSIGALVFTVLSTIVVMAAIFCAVFFWVVKSPERVLVPNVVGESLEDALLSMQIKELYPKISLRYSNSASEKGMILEQNPQPGTIVKAGRRINLVVSKGVVVDRVGDYTGLTVDAVHSLLQTQFAGSAVQQIKLTETPMYQTDDSPAGTILEQDPPPDTAVDGPVTVQLVVSSGPANETTIMPWLVGMSLNDALLMWSRYKVIYQFTAVTAEEGVAPGTIISQKSSAQFSEEDGTCPIYSVGRCEIAIPDKMVNNNVYGIYETSLPNYPYALNVTLDVEALDGSTYNLVTLRHTGGKLTIPYAVPRYSVLVLSVQGKEIGRTTVQ